MRIQFFHSSILSTLFFISVLLLSITRFCGCAAANESCSELFYNCGSLKRIGYPFWGGDRPQSCGIRPLQLQCEDNQNTILLIGDIFIVLRIEESSSKMTIARYDLWTDICLKRFTNTSWLNFELFNRSQPSYLIISYGCSFKEGKAVPSIAQVQSNITCPVNDMTMSAVGVVASNFSKIQGCNLSIVAPVEKRAYNELLNGKIGLNEAFKMGFTLDYEDLITACQNNSDIYYCPSLTSTGTNKANKALKLAIGISAAGIGMIICLLIWFCKFKKPSSGRFNFLLSTRKRSDGRNLDTLIEQFGFLAPKRYRYSDIKKITNSFKDKLGSGGYGDVYKGNLLDGSPVAVKLLKVSKGDGEDFVNEVASISRTSHVNIVTLLGFCTEGQKRALLYEFMSNGSLEKFIYGENMQKHLGWEKLYQIALGVARGLEYLHRGCNTRILHLDIKPHNILLDEIFFPKISDFGLAKLCTRKESIVSMPGVRGTIGYIAPEVISRNFGGVSNKSDVYSYGMMVLEMVGGRKNISVEVSHTSEIYFPHWVYHHLVIGEDLKLKGVESQESNEIARKMIIVGLWCIQTDPFHRPAMAKVIEMLEGNLQALEIPPKPFFGSPSRSTTNYSPTVELS